MCSRWIYLLDLTFLQSLRHLEQVWLQVCAHFVLFLQDVHPSILRFLMHQTL
jgi:hypothetical protein